jgi:hypothetical protein
MHLMPSSAPVHWEMAQTCGTPPARSPVYNMAPPRTIIRERVCEIDAERACDGGLEH